MQKPRFLFSGGGDKKTRHEGEYLIFLFLRRIHCWFFNNGKIDFPVQRNKVLPGQERSRIFFDWDDVEFCFRACHRHFHRLDFEGVDAVQAPPVFFANLHRDLLKNLSSLCLQLR